MSDEAKCSCNTCSERIAFPVEMVGQTVECPHCKIETLLFIPPTENRASAPVSDDPLMPLPKSPDKYSEYVRWLFKGAALGDVESMSLLGVVYSKGWGVEQNYSEAVKWLSQAAQWGSVMAQYNLGACYLLGFKNYTEAEKWIRKAAEQGEATAQYTLGGLYHTGQGVVIDPHTAFNWWLKAAEGGHAKAQNNVAAIYEAGEIIAQDYVEADKWSRLAAAQGVEGADEHSDAFILSAVQREESQRRIDAFKPRPDEHAEDGKIIERLARMGDSEAKEMLAAVGEDNDDSYKRSRTISSETRREVWRRDEGKCVKCGSRERLEYDHIIPFSEGGSNTSRNIQLLCEACNRAKSDSIQ